MTFARKLLSVVLGTLLVWMASTFIEIIPSPVQVLGAFLNLIVEGYRGTSLSGHLLISLSRLLFGIFLGAFAALSLLFVAKTSQLIDAVVTDWVDFIRLLPPLSYYVLLVALAGIGELPKVILLALAAGPPIYVTAKNAIENVPERIVDPFKSMLVGKWPIFVSVELPHALPKAITGLRVGTGFAFTTLVAAEIFAATAGIGWLVLDASRYLRFDVVLAGIIIIAILGLAIDSAIRFAEERGSNWSKKS